MLLGMILSSILFVGYAFLCFKASDKSIERLQNTKLLLAKEKVEKLDMKMDELAEAYEEAAGNMSARQDKKFKKKAKSLKKSKQEAEKELAKLESGKFSIFDIVSLAGYSLMEILNWDVNSPVLKKLIYKCQQLKKKETAIMYSYYIVAQLISLAIVGGIIGFALLSVGLANDLGTRTLVVFIVPIALCIIVGYLPLDEVNSEVEKRKESIEKDFPQVISKLALLASAGLEVKRAWDLTMKSSDGVLYEEMRIVSRDLDNNVSPVEAYHRMQVKCANKYVTKLTQAITQNMYQGNKEIVKYLKALNDESWMERKHSTRRMAEKIQSKLFIPTLLMFAGIIILIIVPVMSGFNMF